MNGSMSKRIAYEKITFFLRHCDDSLYESTQLGHRGPRSLVKRSGRVWEGFLDEIHIGIRRLS